MAAQQADVPAAARRLRRAERREQILAAATRAFARTGFAATSLDDVAAEASVSRVILYRHFDSKSDLYRAVLDRVCAHLSRTVGENDFTDESIADLMRAAAEEPDGFRLLFHHAFREPDFRDLTDRLRHAGSDVARRNLSDQIPSGPWAEWAAHVTPIVAIEAVIAWLDAGQPDPDTAADRVRQAIHGVIEAARS